MGHQKKDKKVLKIADIKSLNKEEQRKLLTKTLSNFYDDEDNIDSYSQKCLDFLNNNSSKRIKLPSGVIAEKIGDNVSISSKSSALWALIPTMAFLLLLAGLGASYSFLEFNRVIDLNKDLNNDGIADINIDLNKDKRADINIDTNRDNKPDINIDYRGNRKAIFGIIKYNKIINPVNNDVNKDGVCDLNCDIDNDGWPDINLDLDGDGVADINIDKNNDGRPDLNFDMKGDMVCDLHCDTTGDGICDTYCLTSEELTTVVTTVNGAENSSDVTIHTEELILEYVDDSIVNVNDVYPDDQPFYEQNIPSKKFKLSNKSEFPIVYNLRWIVYENDYETDNLVYNVTSTNNGGTSDFKPVPKKTTDILTNITIEPNTTQEYTIDFKLIGIGENQNIDGEKTFRGKVDVYIEE